MDKKIIVAEDMAGIRTNLVRTLGERGYEVKGVCEGGAALELIAQNGMPDLLVTDIDMREGKQEEEGYVGMNGDELIKELAKRDYQFPILVHTANYGSDTFDYRGRIEYVSKIDTMINKKLLPSKVAELLA